MAKELWIESSTRCFGSADEDKLAQFLERQERTTRLRPLTTIQDVLMDGEGRLGGRYRPTRSAFRQLCARLGCGVYNLLTDWSGLLRRSNESRNDFSFAETTETFNRLLRRRFASRLCGMHCLYDSEACVIESIVSPDYAWMPGSEFYRCVAAAVQVSAPPLRFLEASCAGDRKLLLRYVQAKPAATLGEADHFYRGCHFTTAETASAAARGAMILYRRRGGTASLSAMTSPEIHRGGDLAARVSRLVERVVAELGRADDPGPALAQLAGKSLVLGNGEEERKRIGQAWYRLFHRRGLPGALGRRIFTGFLDQGSYDPEPLPHEFYVGLDRTLFDLYNALGREAKHMPAHLRGHAERLAHAVLAGKIQFPQQGE